MQCVNQVEFCYQIQHYILQDKSDTYVVVLFDDNCHKFAKMSDCEQKALCPELIEPVQYYIGLF